ncbi:Transmembrane protein 39A, partial [Araneus ventricosus]
STLHYDVHFVTQYGVFTGIGCFTLYISHCFPPKYCDVLHKAALHLGRWQRVEIKNVHVPYSTWTESAMWNQGALVKHSKELFKAEGISNAAEPGHTGHSRFYSLFKNPATAAQLVWFLLVLLLFAECSQEDVLECSRDKRPARGGKTKGLQKKKIRPTKRYDSSSDSSDYYDPPLVDSDDDFNLDINDGDKPDSSEATCIFCDGKFSEDTRGEVWVKCVIYQM